MPDDAAKGAVATEKEYAEIKRIMNILDIEAGLPDEANEGFALDIMESILSAESEEEVFERQIIGSTAGKDFVNRPFRLREDAIAWKRSSRIFVEQGAFPFYALMTVTEIGTGEEVTIDCGGKTFVAALRKLQELGAFTRREKEGGMALVLIGKPAAGTGNTVLILQPYAVPAPRRAKTSA